MTDLRQQLIDSARRMQAAGLNRGTAGNLSVRVGEAGTGNDGDFLITPTGMAYDELVAADIVHMHHEGSCQGRRRPSSEWRFHRDLYAARADAGAILHAHSPFATSIACLRRDGIELETLCEQYWRACQLGQPVLLDATEMATVLDKFASYGQQP
ncbi:MAG: L-fuculose phosphate aldolase [Candidatus Accumulibacter phosphatis]|uniref:L-fuculose phosphate aldolase n=1 Tax=Candidatus Accumulibacter phosphatis TaxID=327160 RepID=A0A080LUS7_9PROT|nr:MAG: L-fuculose phosphate aldolase [Candidatus Accumulibacter phosphatis]